MVEDEERVRATSVEALRDLGYSDSRPRARRMRCEYSTRPIGLAPFHRRCHAGYVGARTGRSLAGKRPDLKALYTTGYTRNAILHNGMLDPGTNLLTKPFSIEELAAKVRKILR